MPVRLTGSRVQVALLAVGKSEVATLLLVQETAVSSGAAAEVTPPIGDHARPMEEIVLVNGLREVEVVVVEVRDHCERMPMETETPTLVFLPVAVRKPDT